MSGDFDNSSYMAFSEVVNCMNIKLGITAQKSVGIELGLFLHFVTVTVQHDVQDTAELFLVKQQNSNIGRLMKFPLREAKIDARTYIVRFASLMVSINKEQV